MYKLRHLMHDDEDGHFVEWHNLVIKFINNFNKLAEDSSKYKHLQKKM